MYERNAIVLERYFNQMFGYNLKNNIKANFIDYCELIECLEKYKQVSEEEENIVSEYDFIAGCITEIQKNQEVLNKKNDKLQQLRKDIFQNIDDSSENIQRKIYDINNNIQNINGEIQENAQKFIDYLGKFNEKTSTRTKCEKSMRTIEAEYNKRLNDILDNYKDIDIVIERKAKAFIDAQTNEIEGELINKITKNGEKEKIPFSRDVIEKAIKLCIEIQKKENRIFVNIYEKSNRLFNEIKNNTLKPERHKKIIIESKTELEFLSAMKEYLVQFLDNERLTAVNGEKDHDNLMKEACKNLEIDLKQINNLYTLLEKEMSNKVTKKAYTDLYNIGYLKDLERVAEEFDIQIKKLNLPVTIINPNYWRIDGMRKIYDVFNNCVTNNYGRDIFEFIPKEEEIENKQDLDLNNKIELTKNINTDIKTSDVEKKNAKSEIDKKIDLILGANNATESEEEIIDDEDQDADADEDEDYWFNNDKKNNIDEENDTIDDDESDWSFEDLDNTNEEWDNEDENEGIDDDWDDEEFNEDWDNKENIINRYSEFIEDDQEDDKIENNDNIDDEDENGIFDTEEDEVIEELPKTLKKSEKKSTRKRKNAKEDEEIEETSKSDKKKGRHTKQGGFFGKFKK